MRWVMPPDRFFSDKNVPKLQYIPILISEDGSYPLEANTYMVERSCGEWAPGEEDYPPIPTLKSRQGIADRLCAFLRYCRQVPSNDWRLMTYAEHLLGEYQPGLLKGTCSASGNTLQPATVNVYLDEATAFLRWAAERGYRGPFKVPRRRVRVRASSGNHSHSNRGKVVFQRHGKMQVIGDPLPSLPTDQEVGRWTNSVRSRAPVKALLFEFIVRTGARLSEANQLRLACFPDKSYEGSERWNPRWLKRGCVPVTLRYGVKGGKVEPASSISTRSRTIEVPIDLADRMWHYKQLIRPTILRRFTRGDRSKDRSDGRFWLGESKGQPVSNAMLYKAWTKARHCPTGWNPHDGRHFFAVEKICEQTRLLMRHHGHHDPSTTSIGWLHGLLAGQVRLILSPLMGHVSENTTMRYLKCAHHRLIDAIGHPALDWNELIDSDSWNDQ